MSDFAIVASSEGADLSVFVSHLVRRSQQRAVDLFAQAVGPEGLTHQQFILLLAVDQNPGMTQTVLVYLTGIDRSTLTDMIGRLSTRGYLKRKVALRDKRANEISITPKGRKVLQTSLPSAIAADRAFIEELPVGKRAAFIDALKILAAPVEEDEVEDIRPRRRRQSA